LCSAGSRAAASKLIGAGDVECSGDAMTLSYELLEVGAAFGMVVLEVEEVVVVNVAIVENALFAAT
jgi:hypothetical protein